MAREISKYALESAYKSVERDALANTAPQEKPTAILLGGQPGSGKSALAAAAIRDLREVGGAVVIDADRMREENPRYKQLSITDPKNAADLTQKEAGEWSTRLTIAAIENKRNLVIDGTMRNPDNIRDLATRLKEYGYNVEARVLAVNSETSLMRARLRYEHQVVERETGRWVNKEQHDVAYGGMPKSVELIERARIVDDIRVYDANQRQVYGNKLEGGEWSKEPAASQAIERERNRELTHPERVDRIAVLEEIAAIARQREGVRDNVSYIVATPGQVGNPHKNVYDAAEAFGNARPEDRPYVAQVTRDADGHETAISVARTEVSDAAGEKQFQKVVGTQDQEFLKAYAAIGRARPLVPDLDTLTARVDEAKADLAQYEQRPTYQRALAFENLSKFEALERHPELDGAYKHMIGVKQALAADMPVAEKESRFLQARSDILEQLHRGEIPKGNVTVDESRRVIEAAADFRGLSARDIGELQRDYKGEVVAQSAHHVLLKVSDQVAVVYEKTSLNKDVQVGEKIAIQYDGDRSQVHDLDKSPATDRTRSADRGMER